MWHCVYYVHTKTYIWHSVYMALLNASMPIPPSPIHSLGFSHFYFRKLQMPEGGNQPIYMEALLWALKMCANASPWG